MKLLARLVKIIISIGVVFAICATIMVVAIPFSILLLQGGTQTEASAGCATSSDPAVPVAAAAQLVPAGPVSDNLSNEVPQVYRDVIAKVAAMVPKANPALMATTLWKEQGMHYPEPPPPYGHGNPWSVSGASAIGPWQFIPTTWQHYGKDLNSDGFANPNDLLEAAYANATFLVALGGGLDALPGDVAHPEQKGTIVNALASYNAGPAGNFGPSNTQTWDYFHSALPYYLHLLTGAPLIGTPVQPAAAPCIPPVVLAASVGNLAPGGLAWPVSTAGSIVASCYGPRVMDGKSGFHPGLDIDQSLNAPVYAISAGTVMFAGPVNGFGDNYVAIHHAGSLGSGYGHMNAMLVSIGQVVTQGQQIGVIGTQGVSTGPHLHLNVIDFGLGSDLFNGNADPLKSGMNVPPGVPNLNGCT